MAIVFADGQSHLPHQTHRTGRLGEAFAECHTDVDSARKP
jgi:hypothetical protein